MKTLRLFAVASIAALPGAIAAKDENDDPLISGFPGFATWYRSHGGTLDDHVTIGLEPGSDVRGMIATAPIPAGALLIHTPGNLVLPISGDACQHVQAIINEIRLGDQSKWQPYFEFDGTAGSHVPTQWDRSNGPGRAMNELQGLPPAGDTHRHVDWYQRACNEGKDLSDIEERAFLMFLTRAADIGLVPMYDLMNHHNGKINTRLERDGDGGLKVIASVDIPTGTPIYNTYARAGMESTVDVFNTYGFVDDFPQLFRWSTDDLVRLSEEGKDHARRRYGMVNSEANTEPAQRPHFEPNTHHYEVLVVSPTLAALAPTKQLVQILGNGQRTLEEWEMLIRSHHANLRFSHAMVLHDSAKAILDGLPTTIEEDEVILPDEKRRLAKARRAGRVDLNKADAIRAIEFRLAFKKALWMSVEVAEGGVFLEDREL
mmetsp:Transcript_38323/g.92429  ORF Transcript_38323/g.92429 Transcript_38323/m.92429 type:complete len:431 (-) Transcript_38323:39-1331(-)|eukprot:CAMPEP_0181119820 /NCGR_PEP_ID=MMETSP1071-20121207/23804_1 /TAXON_ID=35127 /ORGANISM="Thalassiosira sp., Strain NH16" /LENGTH=430 /DNA_ID=CAMNT_0023204389 /DNA_START=96 /DNA_END=1388 /DNA_ORIENTATION=-